MSFRADTDTEAAGPCQPALPAAFAKLSSKGNTLRSTLRDCSHDHRARQLVLADFTDSDCLNGDRELKNKSTESTTVWAEFPLSYASVQEGNLKL